jgi:acyl carrier protein
VTSARGADLDRAQIEELVITLLAEAVVMPRQDVADLRTNIREDLGMDSMDYVDLITVLERELGQRVEREQLAYVRTVGDVVDLVCELTAKRDAATATPGEPSVIQNRLASAGPEGLHERSAQVRTSVTLAEIFE